MPMYVHGNGFIELSLLCDGKKFSAFFRGDKKWLFMCSPDSAVIVCII